MWMLRAPEPKDKQTLGHKTADFIFTCAMNCSVWPRGEWMRLGTFFQHAPASSPFEVFITRAAINLLIWREAAASDAARRFLILSTSFTHAVGQHAQNQTSWKCLSLLFAAFPHWRAQHMLSTCDLLLNIFSSVTALGSRKCAPQQ